MGDYIFICYAHQNSAFAQKLAARLRQAGVAVWLDQWELRDNQAEWPRSIRQAIHGCRQFLLVLSPEALESWVVQHQLALARQGQKPVAVALRQPCLVPLALAKFPCFDCTQTDRDDGPAQAVAYFSGRAAARPRFSWRHAVRAAWQTVWWGGLGPLLGLALLAVGGLWLGPPLPAEVFKGPVTMERLPVIEAHLAATPAGPPVDARMRAIDGMAQVRVPAGTFRMGSAAEDPAAAEDEKPRRAVTLDGFWIDRTEVSNFQYRQCVAAGGCSPHRSQGSRFEGDYQPVVGVNWYQAARYCRWAGGRLPTEAEWEKAARGVDGRIYPWGNVFDGARLNWCDSNCIADWRNFDLNDGYRYTAPVGSYLLGASPYGALDMSGNVWEWTADWYQPQAYAQAAGNNPTGPAKGVQKVVRGGSWLYYGKNLRVTARHKDLPGYSYDNIGFRCVMEE